MQRGGNAKRALFRTRRRPESQARRGARTGRAQSAAHCERCAIPGGGPVDCPGLGGDSCGDDAPMLGFGELAGARAGYGLSRGDATRHYRIKRLGKQNRGIRIEVFG